MTIRANFSDSGLDVGLNATNMTYLYGLSDFFSVMFEDTSTINLLLEAETSVASEVYSRFLQYTSTLSLEGIQETTNCQVKLVMLSSKDAVQGEINTYVLPENIRATKYIANRAFLPTELLDENVEYLITQRDDGKCQIKFAKPLNNYSLPLRLLSDGVTEQRALWFVDAELDEKMISTYYGNLIGVSPENASERFADFVYGLFYVYMHGPKLETLSRGLNLALGIPVARSVEEVLSIRTYLETDQYLVICNQNQYLIPYGLEPSISEGDTLELGQPLAQWVEIKDYEHDGDWWINLHLPERLIPQVPEGQKDRYATKGSHFDYLMRNYLKKHTFLVRVKVTTFKNIQQFVQISDIIKRAKPCYTEAIYVWTVDSTELIDPIDSLKRRFDGNWDDNIKVDISRLRRDNIDDPIIRGRRSFFRYNVDRKVTRICGDDTYANNYTTYLGADIINGFVNPVSQFHANSEAEKGWIRAILHRGHSCYHGFRNKVGFHRGSAAISTADGNPVRTDNSSWEVPYGMKMVPLYITTLQDMINKAKNAALPEPGIGSWWFEIFSTRAYGQAVNDLSINYLPPDYDPNAASSHFNQFFYRSTSVGYIGREFNENSLISWAPKVSDVNSGDYLVCIKITDTTLGVYWVTSNSTIQPPAYFPVGEIDPLRITYNMPLSRGGGLNGSPFYVLRGAGSLNYNTVDAAINSVAINESEGSSGTSNPVTYTDLYNTTPVTIDRSGVKIVHAVESL